MSKIFYDHLIILEEVDLEIKKISQSSEEREELWRIVDELVHYNVLICILERLPKEHHGDFLERLHASPHDERIINFLNEKVGDNIEKILEEKIKSLEKDILKEIRRK